MLTAQVEQDDGMLEAVFECAPAGAVIVIMPSKKEEEDEFGLDDDILEELFGGGRIPDGPSLMLEDGTPILLP